MHLVLRGAYGPIKPGTLHERLAVEALKEEQMTELSKVRVLIAAAAQADSKEINAAYKDYVSLQSPEMDRRQKKRDKAMRTALKQESKKGAFWIEVQGDPSAQSLRRRKPAPRNKLPGRPKTA